MEQTKQEQSTEIKKVNNANKGIDEALTFLMNKIIEKHEAAENEVNIL